MGKGKCACSYSLCARVQRAQSDNEADSVSDMSACIGCDDCRARGRRGITSLLGRSGKSTLPTSGDSRSIIGPGAHTLRRGWIGVKDETSDRLRLRRERIASARLVGDRTFTRTESHIGLWPTCLEPRVLNDRSSVVAKGYLSAPRRGSRRSDGVPPVRENLSRRADEVAGRSPGKRAAPGFC
jgi:hypothetical protein